MVERPSQRGEGSAGGTVGGMPRRSSTTHELVYSSIICFPRLGLSASTTT